MNIEHVRRQLVSNLEIHLNQTLPKHSIKEIYQYAVLPPGKLFRGLLVAALARDHDFHDELENPWSDHSIMASFVEIHHAYTLVHDDLPCMDDDSIRRGRLSLHKRYGQWQAVLVGDGLMGVGYNLLSFMKTSRLKEILRFVSWATGPKGLIHGQVLDLLRNERQDFENIKTIHTLKTARLIQTALLGSALLLEKRDNVFYRDTFKVGHNLGLLFQFLDDLTELSSALTSHEKVVNAWLCYPDKTFEEVEKCFERIRQYCVNRPVLKAVLLDYGKNIHKICRVGEKNIVQKIPERYMNTVLDFCNNW